MLLRRVAFGIVLAFVVFGAGAVSLTGCSAGGSTPTIVSVGAAGSAGTTTGGAAGATTSGAAGDDSGAAGRSSGGSAGAGSGQAGTGASGKAGASGGAGAGGTTTGGTAGAIAITGAGGGRPSGPTAACNADAPADPIQKAVEHDLVVTVASKYMPAYVSRKYFTTLPMGFNPKTPYPVVFYGQGCGQTGSEGSSFTSGHFLTDIFYVQLIPAAVDGKTVVPSDGSPGCFQAGKQGFADSPDGPYFDQVLAEIEQKYCIDKGKLYVAGSSSGAWLSNYLACARGNVLRGAAADSGGLQHDHGTCTGGAAIMEMPGDTTSSLVGGFDIGVGPARDTFIATNGCSKTATAMTFGSGNCQLYAGCDSPVVWCDVGGGHQSGQGVIAADAWAFWSTLK
jgi:poly(3-hydroxybutyrate) depolymerase